MNNISLEDQEQIRMFKQFLQWAGGPDEPTPYRHLAVALYNGIMTIEEGQRIEQGRQVWQEWELHSA